ncbi:MAG: TolC family protein [Pyrinomonadaceae bacterium]
MANTCRDLLLILSFVISLSAVSLGQTPPAQTQPTVNPSPTPGPQAKPSTTPTTASPAATPQQLPSVTPNLSPLSLDQAIQLANAQASAFQQAGINEQIAAEDVRQAEAAFLPRLSAPVDYIYTSPALGLSPAEPRIQSFIANNAIAEYQALLSVTGDVDVSGRLRATLARNRALLAAARAGTEVARRTLAQAVLESYYGLALASAQRIAAEENLAAAEEFEHTTALLFSGGEIAAVDLTRARQQTNARRDELERAHANEIVAAGALRVLIGYDFLRPLSTSDLSLTVPEDDQVTRVSADAISRRPEFAQFEAERQAAQAEINVARADRRPQLSYVVSGGFDTDSLRPPRLKEHTGVSAAVNLSIPIFDWGGSKSRERQARLRAQIAESERAIAARTFAEQFYSARAQAQSAATRIRLAQEAIRLAETNLRASIARYRGGEAQIIEVTDAQTALVNARQSLFQASFDYQVALARLEQAAGQ